MSDLKIRRGYIDTSWGQLHYRECGSGPLPALICLHATAYSSQTFVPLMPLVARNRRVIALDTPGYGQSDGPDTLPDLQDYAEVMMQAIAGLEPGRQVSLLGYHTGAMIGCEMAASSPDMFDRLVLIGIPYFEGETRAEWRRKLVHEHDLGEDFGQFEARWRYFVSERARGVSLERGFEWFVDELKSWPRDYWAHHALFEYNARGRLPHVTPSTLVINPAAPLAQASRDAASLMPDAIVKDVPQLSAAIFDLGPDIIAAEILDFL